MDPGLPTEQSPWAEGPRDEDHASARAQFDYTLESGNPGVNAQAVALDSRLRGNDEGWFLTVSLSHCE
jgi:hypothetical protein